MPTECSADLFGFARVEGRAVVASFDGGALTSDAGALLLGATDRAIGLVERFAACFRDACAAGLIEHEVRPLVGQRVFVRALGYEDLNDHDTLRHDPILAVLAGKLTPRRKDCAPVAGKSTLNRLELSRDEPSRYHKIGHDPAAIEELWVDLFIEAHARAPKQIILDLDATDDPLHGDQEGRFFHAYYGGYCYLPLYVFCGRHLLAAKLRRSNLDAAAGAVAEIARIVAPIRRRWPRVRILLRADSGFLPGRPHGVCEVHAVDYLFGLARCSAWRATTGSPPRSPPRIAMVSGFLDILQLRAIFKRGGDRGAGRHRQRAAVVDHDVMRLCRPCFCSLYVPWKLRRMPAETYAVNRIPFTIDTQQGMVVLSSSNRDEFQGRADASQPPATPEGSLG